MPTPPDATALRARFPAFASVSNDTVNLWLTDAQTIVGETWIEADYAPAIMELAAHNMAMLGLESGTAALTIPAGVTRFRSGSLDMSVSEAQAQASAAGGYSGTVYGRMFLARLRRNRGGPISVQSAPPLSPDVYWPAA